MTSYWLDQLGRTVWRDTKFLRRRPRFAKTPSNTLAFTCHRSNPGSAPRENKLSVPFQPSRPADRSERFWELKVSAESGSLTTVSG
jgi:hypothetical protein